MGCALVVLWAIPAGCSRRLAQGRLTQGHRKSRKTPPKSCITFLYYMLCWLLTFSLNFETSLFLNTIHLACCPKMWTCHGPQKQLSSQHQSHLVYGRRYYLSNTLGGISGREYLLIRFGPAAIMISTPAPRAPNFKVDSTMLFLSRPAYAAALVPSTLKFGVRGRSDNNIIFEITIGLML